MIPEQTWDAADVPDRELYNGRPAGSAMPLAWAHAEYVKLLRALRDGRIFDMPPQPVARYQRGKQASTFRVWQFNHKVRHLARGKRLRLVLLAPAQVRWTADGWRTAGDMATRDTGLGVHVADLTTDSLPAGATVTFTFFWTDANTWEGTNFDVDVE
jgi:glucoamylase